MNWTIKLVNDAVGSMNYRARPKRRGVVRRPQTAEDVEKRWADLKAKSDKANKGIGDK